MRTSDSEYYSRRAEQERALASEARNPSAANIHSTLAHIYASKAGSAVITTAPRPALSVVR